MKKITLLKVVIAMVLVSSLGTLSQDSVKGALNAPVFVGTSFTYQGKLSSNGSPTIGHSDFEFKLYNSANGGAQISSTVIKDNVTVNNGLFTVELDFGDVFDGTALWLQIGVREGSSTGAYTTLTPRQALTATPYALSMQPGALIRGNLSSKPVIRGANDSTAGSVVAVLGEITSTSPGGFSTAVRGINKGIAGNGIGVWGSQDGSGWGVYGRVDGSGGRGVYGRSNNGWAGYFSGNVNVSGSLSKASGSFKIDHPLDPQNKYLYHSFVESPDMKNIYDGVITLNGNGTARVQLPDWFEALNQDFRYQLTAIGAAMPNLYISQEITGNIFQIAGGESGKKVSWQVTGIRKDQYAEAYRIPVEEEKPAFEIGTYLYPEVFGQAEELGLDYKLDQEMLGP